MLRCKDVPSIFSRKLRAAIKSHLQRCIVRLQYYIWRDDFLLHLGMLPRKSWVLIAAHVPPRPAIEATLLHVRDVVGYEVIAQSVSLVYRAPQLAGFGVYGQTDSIANAGSIDAHPRTVGIVFKDSGPILLRCRIVDILLRSHGDKHLFAVGRELNVS